MTPSAPRLRSHTVPLVRPRCSAQAARRLRRHPAAQGLRQGHGAVRGGCQPEPVEDEEGQVILRDLREEWMEQEVLSFKDLKLPVSLAQSIEKQGGQHL